MLKAIAVVSVLLLIGCSNAKAFKMPDLNLLKHEQTGDIQAVKTGDIAPIKGGIKADATVQPITGVSNTADHAGRDISRTEKRTSINSDKVMLAIISAMSAALGSLGSIVLALLAFIKVISKQRAAVESRLLDFMAKQEEGQNKYIDMLERIAGKATGITNEKEGKS